MTIVTIHTAKTTLSQLIVRAEAGEEIVLARGAQPVARIVPLDAPARKRRFGAYRGQVTVADSFFEPLSEDALKEWER